MPLPGPDPPGTDGEPGPSTWRAGDPPQNVQEYRLALLVAQAYAAGRAAALREGWEEGHAAGYARAEEDMAAFWRPLAQRIRRQAGAPSWAELQAIRARADSAGIDAHSLERAVAERRATDAAALRRAGVPPTRRSRPTGPPVEWPPAHPC